MLQCSDIAVYCVALQWWIFPKPVITAPVALSGMCTALHCTVLHCTALHCNALHFNALNCTALNSTSLHLIVLNYTVAHVRTALDVGEVLHVPCSPEHSPVHGAGEARSMDVFTGAKNCHSGPYIKLVALFQRVNYHATIVTLYHQFWHALH